MRRLSIMAGAMLAVVAVLAIAAATASAEPPTIGRCLAQAGGKYANSGCSKIEAGKNKFEWFPGVIKKGLHGVLKEGIPTLETVSGTKITCTGLESPGEVTGLKTIAGVKPTFTGCETSKLKCESVGQAEGTIVTASLEGEIGIEKRVFVEGVEVPAKNKVALELHAPAGQNVAEFACAGVPVVVRGCIMHPVATNKMLSTSTEKYVAKAGEQKPDHFYGGKADECTLESNTNGGPFEEAGETLTATSFAEEKIEASTVN